MYAIIYKNRIEISNTSICQVSPESFIKATSIEGFFGTRISNRWTNILLFKGQGIQHSAILFFLKNEKAEVVFI